MLVFKSLPSVSRLHEVFDIVDGRLLDKSGNIRDKSISDGYRNSFVDKQIYRTHRLIWKMCKGYDPEILDHKDRDRLNNKIENLREASHSLNVLNVDDSRYTNSYPRCIRPHGNKWRARISHDNQRYHLGLFKTIEEAIEAYELKRKELYYG